MAFVVLAAASSVPALIQATGEIPSPGSGSGQDASLLIEVLPGAPAWRMGARVGDRVISIESGPTEETWVMETERGTYSMARMTTVLRETVPMALIASCLMVLAALLLPIGPAMAAAAAAIAVALTERTFMATGDVAWSTGGAVAAMALPGLWFATFAPGPRWPRLLVGTTAGVVVGLWLLARYWSVGSFEIAEVLRILLTYGLVLLLVVVVLGGAIHDAYGGYDARRFSDVIVISCVAGILAIAIIATAPLEALVPIVAVPLLAYPILRGRLRHVLDRLVLGDLRSRAAIEATERERARMAREIHDEPLQRLAAMAHRLDARPELADEAAALRSISNQLRDLSVELHPQILADFGLRAALADLAERIGRESRIPCLTDLGEQPATDAHPRPPADIELAFYRVAQEALSNAVRHSGAGQIELRSRVAAEAVELTIRDDGVGLDDVAMREAVPRGHVGIRSMTERAELVGARFRIEPAGPGTRVTMRWPA